MVSLEAPKMSDLVSSMFVIGEQSGYCDGGNQGSMAYVTLP